MLRVRHECKLKYISKVNEKLTEVQKSRIQATPFKWLISLPNKMKISGNLLEQLVERWDERGGGFLIQGRIIRFTPLDVCFALGLRIVGEKVDFKEDPRSTTKGLFDKEGINTKTIYAKITKMEGDEEVEQFCRLYILLGFAEFYFPNSSSNVSGWCLKFLDDLNSIGKYNWGVDVYEIVVGSLNRVACRLRDGKNSSSLNIKGCAAILQVWALEHVLGYQRCNPNFPMTFPRFMKACGVTSVDKNIPYLLDNNLVIEELSATKEEVADKVVMEALVWAPSGYIKWGQNSVHKPLIDNIRWLSEANKSLEATILQLELETKQMKLLDEGLKDDNEMDDVLMEYIEMVIEREVANVSDNEDYQASTLLTRIKNKPRNREESVFLRTPWVKGDMRKKKKTNEVV